MAACACTGCKGLYDEVVRGTKPELMDSAVQVYEHYRIRLLKKGWAGQMSTAERAYVRAHRSEAQSVQAAAAGVRMKSYRLAQNVSTEAGTGADGSPTGAGPL